MFSGEMTEEVQKKVGQMYIQYQDERDDNDEGLLLRLVPTRRTTITENIKYSKYSSVL